jgi:methyl-accepting chemotaxis protein
MAISRFALPRTRRLSRWMPGKWGEFFAYHGIWALGVRPLRNLEVRAKVTLLVLVLGLPLAALGIHLVASQQEAYRLARMSAAGVRLVAEVSALRVELESSARAVETGQEPGIDRRAAAYVRMQVAFEAALGAGLPVGAAWEKARPLIERAVQAADLPYAARRPVDAQALAASQELRERVASSVRADAGADPRRAAMADLALHQLPALQSTLGELRRAVAPGAEPGQGPTREARIRIATRSGEVQALRSLADAPWQAVHAAEPATPALPAVRRYLDWVGSAVLASDSGPDLAEHARLYDSARTEAGRAREALLSRLFEDLEQTSEQARRTRDSVAMGVTACLIVAAFVVYSFFLVMNGGLRQLSRQMEAMADGNLSARLRPHGRDEIAQTMREMTRALVQVSDLMAEVRNGAAAVNQAAQVVAEGNAGLSQRDAEQAGKLVEAVAAVDAFTRGLLASGREVETVVNRVQALRLDVVRHRKHMLRLAQRMDRVRVGSQEIGEIVRTIDGIAFRTNILALNASVEASKAGEAGRGFAVVAQEVRSLALRSGEASRRVGEIVARSGLDVEACGALVQEASEVLAQSEEQVGGIVGAVGAVTGLSRSGLGDAESLKARSPAAVRPAPSRRPGVAGGEGLAQQTHADQRRC